MPGSVHNAAARAGMTFPLSLREFISKAKCNHSRCVRLHFKFLRESKSVTEMLKLMRPIFDTADIGVSVVSRENLVGPDFAELLWIDVGTGTGHILTEEMEKLFRNRNNARPSDIVVYFVELMSSTAKGLTTRERASIIMLFWAGSLTLAHEVGHALGLEHFNEETCWDPQHDPCKEPVPRLMTGCGVCPQDIQSFTPAEIAVIRNSPYTFDCNA